MEPDLSSAVQDRDRDLALERNAPGPQLEGESILVECFYVAGTERLVHLDGGANDLARQLLVLKAH